MNILKLDLDNADPYMREAARNAALAFANTIQNHQPVHARQVFQLVRDAEALEKSMTILYAILKQYKIDPDQEEPVLKISVLIKLARELSGLPQEALAHAVRVMRVRSIACSRDGVHLELIS